MLQIFIVVGGFAQHLLELRTLLGVRKVILLRVVGLTSYWRPAIVDVSLHLKSFFLTCTETLVDDLMQDFFI